MGKGGEDRVQRVGRKVNHVVNYSGPAIRVQAPTGRVVDGRGRARQTGAVNTDLHAFVRDALSRGASRDDIRKALRDARWPEDEIEAELGAWHDAGLGIPVPRRRVGFSPREAFLYLLLFVALYLVAFHVGAILFALIERTWPDPAVSAEEAWARTRDWVRFSLASVLVAFPVYLLTARLTGRAVAVDPEKRNSGVRRWLTYLTLFNAACVLIGDFIAVLLGLFKGELTARFLSKAAIVAAIGGWLFTHYMGGLRRDEAEAPRHAGPSQLARAAGALVVVVALLGLWLAGSPARARRQALDQRRVQVLSQIADAVGDHVRFRRALPSTLDELMMRGGGRPGLTLTDPVTHDRVPYVVLDSLRYQLCADFDAPDSVGPYGEAVNSFWRHGAGRTCFTFDVPPPHLLPPGGN